MINLRSPQIHGDENRFNRELKEFCQSLVKAVNENHLVGDNVTTSISSGIVHAHLPPAYAKNFEYLGFDKDALTIQIGEGYVKQIGDGFYHFEEFVLVLTVPPLLTDGTYFIILDLDLSGCGLMIILYSCLRHFRPMILPQIIFVFLYIG